MDTGAHISDGGAGRLPISVIVAEVSREGSADMHLFNQIKQVVKHTTRKSLSILIENYITSYNHHQVANQAETMELVLEMLSRQVRTDI